MVSVIGAGLAGCEAAYQLAGAGVPVTLCEMKPLEYSPAHKYAGFAELVCSNSLKGAAIHTAPGLLKEEMRRLGSLITPCARATAVDAGGALAVDRHAFSDMVTRKIKSHPLITILPGRVDSLPKNGYVIVATGPLTDGNFAQELQAICGGLLSFYDAAAPIVTRDSIDIDKVFFASRYDKGGADYINSPLNKDQYAAFRAALIAAETAPLSDADKAYKVYEGCMPIETLAKRGEDSIRFGPLKPVGLTDPKTGRRPWANVQLRAENQAGTLYNLVGFQTNLKFGEQKRVFSMLPGLENAEFVRFGVMHRNSFINSPKLLQKTLSLKSDPRIYFAGQLTGTEGYMESAMSGIIAGKNLAARLAGQKELILPPDTMSGAILAYTADNPNVNFQPMGANMGLLPPLPERIRDKQTRYENYAKRALASLEAVLSDENRT